jgi:hypothetical protein
VSRELIYRTIYVSLVTISTLCLAAISQSADIEGTSSAIFTNPSPSSAVVDGVDEDFFEWGIPIDPSPRSSLRYAGETVASDFDEAFAFGTLEFVNGTIQSGTESTSVDLEVTIMLTMPSGVTEEITETLILVNTPNTSDPIASGDRVFLPTSIQRIPFKVGAVDHFLDLLGFGTITGSGGPAGAGADPPPVLVNTISGFFALEGESASAELVGRISVCPKPGFQLSEELVPGSDKKLCYKFSMSKISSDGSFTISLTLLNPNNSDVDLAICLMANSDGPVEPRPEFRASIEENKWTCESRGNANLPPSFHFGCREFPVAAGQERALLAGGKLPPGAKRFAPYVDFLRARDNTGSAITIDDSCSTDIKGENKWLVPANPPGTTRADYVNYWATTEALLPQSPTLGCTIDWPAGNWFTMGNPDTYLARLNGTVLNAPAGTILTFRFPAGTPEPERALVVPPADPDNPSCFGLPLEVSEPFIIPPEVDQADISQWCDFLAKLLVTRIPLDFSRVNLS